MSWDPTVPTYFSYSARANINKIHDDWKILETNVSKDHFAPSKLPCESDGEHRKLTLTEITPSPTSVTDKGFVYAKADTLDTELFYTDADSNEIQLTEDGLLYGDGIMPLAWAYVTKEGSLTGYNLSVAYDTGIYTYTFTGNKPLDTNYAVVANTEFFNVDALGKRSSIIIDNKTVNGFRVRTRFYVLCSFGNFPAAQNVVVFSL